MADARRHARPMLVAGASLFLAWLASGQGPEAKADRITLRGGGQVKGKMIPDREHPGQFLFFGEVGKTPMVFKKDQIVQISPEKGPLDDYVLLRDRPRSTAQAEYDLGAWCEDHKLADLAQLHYELTLKRDSTFDAAHRKLGHVQRDGRWLNADEVKEAQGLVKYKGRWITVEEKERKEAQAATAAEGASWSRRIKLLRDAYLSGSEERAKEAERRLLAIDEPVAVAGVLKILGDDPIPALRTLAARMLGAIPGPDAATGLVGRMIEEEDESVLRATMDELARRDEAEVVPLLLRALRSSRHAVVNRSAWGLGNLNAVRVVPKLVPALITIEYEVVMVGGASGGPGVGFNAVTPGPLNGAYGGPVASLTPPAVGPGAVAFGATSVPYAQAGSSLNIGGGGGRGPVPRLVPVEYRNEEVLNALVKMTGRNFGFDIPAWKQWVATSFKIDAPPSRRVPQP